MSDQDSRLNLLERTCDRCAQWWPDCTVIDDAYICGACRADIEAEEAEVESLRQQLAGAVAERDALLRLLEKIADECMTLGEVDVVWIGTQARLAVDRHIGRSS